MSSQRPAAPVAHFALALAWFIAAPAAAHAVPARPIAKVYVPLEIFADTLAKQQSTAVAHAWADSVARVALARGDRATWAAAMLWHGKRYATHEQDLARGLPYLDSALVAARAMRDTFAIATVWARRAWGEQLEGSIPAARVDYAQAVRYAAAGRLPSLEGLAHRGLGQIAKVAGEYETARHELSLAVRQLPEDSFESLHSRLILGEVLNRTGRPDEARARFEDVLAEAQKRKNRWTIAAALQDLGITAFEQGDMAEADRQWVQAAAHYDTLVARKAIDRSSAIGTRLNRAHALIVLGRLGEAEALLEQQLGESALLGNPAERYATLAELGVLLRRAGRRDEAERVFRIVRASAADDAELEENTSLELAGLLRESGRHEESLALLDSLLVPARRARMTTVNAGSTLMEKSAALRELGRTTEALAAAREGERLTRAHDKEPSIYWLDAIVDLARCQRAAGRPDSAVVTLARAARAWERWRAKISDLEWRERAGSGLAGMFTEYGLALLDPRRRAPEALRAQQAFDALQAFQARTLEERMHGAGLAGRAMDTRVSADSLRRAVLVRGECVLDLVATPDTTFAFVVTRGGVAARLLPGTRRLDALYRDWRDAMLAGAAAPVVEGGLARLSAELLGPLAPLLRESRRVVVSGGGPLALWPLGALTLTGEPGPMGERRDLACVPSATLFAQSRARGEATSAAAPRLLALSRTTDAAGRALPGAERELTMLDRAYERVTVRENKGDRVLSDLTFDLAGYDALHFAAHAEAAPGTPWRSGFLLGRGAGDDAYFRASSVARLRLKARLAVLSGCQSAGATALAGEGALGLSAGFLSAGTRTVVATLWPVDDGAAEQYMDAFYARLSAGRNVAAAAREAGAALRARPDTANPRIWAAFVVLGEPGTTFPLKRRGRA